MALVTRQFNLVFPDITKANVTQTGIIDAPPSNACMIALKGVESARQVEIMAGVTQCRDYLIDNGVYENNAGTIYAYIPIGGGDGDVVQESIIANIPTGSVIVGMAGNYRDRNLGSGVFQSMITNLSMAMRDNYLKAL